MTDLVNSYFGNIIFTKIDQRATYIIYAAALASSLGDGRKAYALAFVPTHMAVKDRAYLRELFWHNFQTRYLKPGYRLPQQTWKVAHEVQDIELLIADRQQNFSTYTPAGSLPLEVILLHDQKKKSKYQFNNKMSMISALSTFECVVQNTPPKAMMNDSFEMLAPPV
jgi:hypothetical protein